jgi:malate permease and related proteins
MDFFTELFTKVLPLYACIGVGYVARRFWGLKNKFVSRILVYLLIPLAIFDNITEADLYQLAAVPLIFFVLALSMNLPARITHRLLAKDLNPHLLSCAFAYFNIGFFGIPIVLAFLGPGQLPLIMSAYVGNALYGDTIGYYQIARAKRSVWDSVKKVFTIPAIYAFALAVVANLNDIKTPESLEPVADVVSWSLSVLGMLIIGIGLAEVNLKKVNYRLFSKILGIRLVSAPLLMALLLWGESQLVGQLEPEAQQLLMLASGFPIAANLVVFASFLESETENAATLVALTTFVSLILIPVVAYFMFAG